MTVFRTFLKILNKNKFIVIMYTIILLVFGGFNMQTSDNNISFTPSKPDIMVINKDNSLITDNFINYLKDNCNVKDTLSSEDKINDSLFYREINYVIYIPKDYGYSFLKGNNPELEIKSTGDYMASLTEMIITRYINTANIYQSIYSDEHELINNINNTLSKEINTTITSKLDNSSLEKAAFYFNFESYSLLACLIYIICLILSIFNNERIHKRIVVSSMDYKKHNRILLLSNFLYAIIVWLFYLLLSFIILKDIMFTSYGIVFMINSFIFTLCATTISFMLGTIINKKEAINGVMNVVALGSSFLCGAFVPQEWLPDIVLKIAHLIPTYYYIKTNELVKDIEIFNFNNLKPLIINMIILCGFILLFIIITNIISNRKRKIG